MPRIPNVVLIYGFLLFIVGGAAYEISLGVAAAVVRDATQNYRLNVTNTTYLTIQQMPDNVYYDTGIIVVLYLAVSLIFLVVALIELYWKVRSKPYPDSFPSWVIKFGFGFGTLVQIVFAAYIANKYDSLSDNDRAVWDVVDPRYMDLFSKMINVVIVIMVGFLLLPGYAIATSRQERSERSGSGPYVLVP